MPLAAPLVSIVISVALAAPTAIPRSYEGATEAPEGQVEAPIPEAPPGPAEAAPAPGSEDEVAPGSAAEADQVHVQGEDLPVDAGPGDDEDEDETEARYGDDYNPLRDSPEALRAASWVRSGVIFTVVGGILTIGAIAMSATDPCDLPAGNGCQETARLRASLALGVPGGILFAGGAAMLAVGKVQQRRLRASLTADRRGFGAVVVLRF